MSATESSTEAQNTTASAAAEVAAGSTTASPRTEQAVEIEAKFSVGTDVEVPPLATIDGIAAVASTATHELSAVYFDTPDLRLTRNKITLRRRTGGKDDGWHVKLPNTGSGRREIRAPLGDYEFTPPAEILAVIRPYIRFFELDPIAQIDNERHEYLLSDKDGDVVAEFVDDHVTAYSLLPTGDISTWREWECELVNGEDGRPLASESLLQAAREVLLAAGAEVADSPSKLLTALGDSIDSAEPLAGPAELPEGSPEAQVLAALQRNRDKIIACDPAVRADEEDSVHQMRVATRELRSHMSTFRGILAGDAYEHTARELKHLAQVLGYARDAEVVAARCEAALAAEDSPFATGEAAEKLLEGIRDIYRSAHADIVALLDSERYAELLNSLDAILADPPLVEEDQGKHRAPDEAAHTAEDVLFLHLTQAMRKVRALHATAIKELTDTSLPLQKREDNVHAVRKAVKKLRYSAEAAGAASELKTGKLYKACSAAQDVLGTFQDTVTARDTLAAVARRASVQGEDTFLYGMLYQQEHDRGVAVLSRYTEVMDDLFAAYAKLEKKRDKLAAKRAKALRAELKAQAKAARKAEKERLRAEKEAARKAALEAAEAEARAKRDAADAARKAAEAAAAEAAALELAAQQAAEATAAFAREDDEE
ncbi:CYTH and CHAD domain-containing protein [Corynebacterium sp. 13CS0277]|uniref:CYTH and CHAD domain-containing protein n=1 Tax=Corynebacterium sp. 13CS0277 TaxID=2071994 RepID=UPI0018EE26ED|nr:CYTH and CHAD domain-containing protein [Corynebacterium sp. 13CS0277]